MPNAATTSERAANTGAGYLADPAMRQLRAEAHAAHGVTEESPFLSVLTDVNGALRTTDPTLRTIATGFPGVAGVERAPFLVEFHVPANLLYTPSNALSAGETELLFFGPDLTRYIAGAIPNPFFPFFP